MVGYFIIVCLEVGGALRAAGVFRLYGVLDGLEMDPIEPKVLP